MEVKPNFFILGFPKCGTTLIRNVFYQHPEIFMSVPEEPGYFDREFRFINENQWHFKNLKDYEKIYSKANMKVCKAIGEGSVYQIYSKDYIKEILKYYPDSRFIICLRNPIKAAVSMHGENLKPSQIGRDPFSSFEKAWNKSDERDIYQIVNKVPSIKFNYKYLYNYYNIIKEVEELLIDRTLYVKFEDLISNSEKEFKKIFNFLNVDESFEIKISHVNKAKQARKDILSKFIWYTIEKLKYSVILKKLRGRGLTNNKFFMKPLKKEEMSKSLRMSLKNSLLTNIDQLEESTGLILKDWCED